jgi:hypothetical protein
MAGVGSGTARCRTQYGFGFFAVTARPPSRWRVAIDVREGFICGRIFIWRRDFQLRRITRERPAASDQQPHCGGPSTHSCT